VTGTVNAGAQPVPISDGKLRGDQITFTAGGSEYTGKVSGDRIEGTKTTNGKKESWSAARGQ
jgi:hypothetical protein